MINSLATALGVAVLSMNAPTTTTTHEEPTRAYYDASQVGNYGTTNGRIYNYTDQTISDEDGLVNDIAPSSNGRFLKFNNAQHTAEYINLEGEDGDSPIIINGTTNYELDFYFDGQYYNTYSGEDCGSYFRYTIELPLQTEVNYIWVFDHQEATMTEGIFEVVGDTITEGAGVIGNGFASLVGIFWDGSSLTGMGILSLITLGISIVWFSFSYVTGLIRKR